MSYEVGPPKERPTDARYAHAGALMRPILGIESSCDETAAAILDAQGCILAEAVLNQAEHGRFGGVVPEIAARAHVEALEPLIEAALADARLTLADVDAVGHLPTVDDPLELLGQGHRDPHPTVVVQADAVRRTVQSVGENPSAMQSSQQ